MGTVGANNNVQTTTAASNAIDLRYRTDGIPPGLGFYGSGRYGRPRPGQTRCVVRLQARNRFPCDLAAALRFWAR